MPFNGQRPHTLFHFYLRIIRITRLLPTHELSLSLIRNQGVWTPSLNVATVLTSIQSLMSGPNPDDPLMADIVRASFLQQLRVKLTTFLFLQNDIYVHNHLKFVETATQWTQKYARDLGSTTLFNSSNKVGASILS